ncbi:MAG TPA: hypothetical protein VIV11_13150 [Kofleriaceae bacterium]
MRQALILALMWGCGGDYLDVCSVDEDCAEELTCFTAIGHVEARCVFVCNRENNFTCPAGYGCYGPRDFSPKPCVPICSTAAECPDGWQCNQQSRMCLEP